MRRCQRHSKKMEDNASIYILALDDGKSPSFDAACAWPGGQVFEH